MVSRTNCWPMGCEIMSRRRCEALAPELAVLMGLAFEFVVRGISRPRGRVK